jgi:hypothetical protein
MIGCGTAPKGDSITSGRQIGIFDERFRDQMNSASLKPPFRFASHRPKRSYRD